jgi:hypothetical protein
MNPDPTIRHDPHSGGIAPRNILKDTSTGHVNPTAAGDVEAKKQVHFDGDSMKKITKFMQRKSQHNFNKLIKFRTRTVRNCRSCLAGKISSI